MRYTPLLVFLVLIGGCKKEQPGSNSCGNLVAMESSASTLGAPAVPYNIVYKYDAQNRLIQRTGQDYEYNYTYGTGTVTETYYQDGALNSTSIGYLNAQGLVFSWVPADTIYYDNLGENILEIQPGDTIVTTWQNGDIITRATHTRYGLYVDTLFYSTNIDNRNFGQPYLGKSPLHLQIAEHIYNDGLMPIWGASNYTFDVCNRVSVSRDINLNIARDTSIVRYTYY